MLALLKRLVELARIRNILIILELLTIPLAIIAIVQSNKSINLQLEANNEQRVATAWNLASTRATGNSGKGEALNFLASQGEDLSGLLLDCVTMGGEYVYDPTRRCKGAPHIEGLRLIASTKEIPVFDGPVYVNSQDIDPDSCVPENLEVIGSDFSGSLIKNSLVYCAMMIDVSMSDTRFVFSTIANSWMYNLDLSRSFGFQLVGNRIDGLVAIETVFEQTDFHGTIAHGMNLTRAKFSGVEFTGLEGADYNVSGANFCYDQYAEDEMSEAACPQNIPNEVLKGMWAWSDQPPVGVGPISDTLKRVQLCPSEYRSERFGEDYGDRPFAYDRGYAPPLVCQDKAPPR